MDKKERYYFEEDEIAKFLDYLARKLHNCLYMYEEKNDTSHKSIHDLSIQIEHLGEYLDFLKSDSKFINLLVTLDFLYEEFIAMDNNEVVRREVFKCMGLLNKIKDDLSEYMERD